MSDEGCFIMPNFFIVGAPKCGTTAMSEYLRVHPCVFLTEPKEPNFFNDDFDHYYNKKALDPSKDYIGLYRDVKPEHLAVGEASVWNLYSSVAIQRIHDFNPDAKLVVMVRNPVELVQSIHSQHLYNYYENVRNLEEAWRLQGERKMARHLPRLCAVPDFLQYGDVARLGAQVERLLNIFPSDQVKLIVFDDFKKDTGRVYRDVLSFLALPDDQRQEFPRINENKIHKLSAVGSFTQDPPSSLLSFLGFVKRSFGIKRLGLMEKIRTLNLKTRRREPISDEFESILKDHFREDVEKLSRLVGRDLSRWCT